MLRCLRTNWAADKRPRKMSRLQQRGASVLPITFRASLVARMDMPRSREFRHLPRGYPALHVLGLGIAVGNQDLQRIATAMATAAVEQDGLAPFDLRQAAFQLLKGNQLSLGEVTSLVLRRGPNVDELKVFLILDP